jgi:hypothetical protein
MNDGDSGLPQVGCLLRRPHAIVRAIVIYQQEVRPLNAVSVMGAPCSRSRA